MTFKLTNLDSFRSKLTRFSSNTSSKFNDVCFNYWKAIFDTAQANVPFKLGELRSSGQLNRIDINTITIIYTAQHAVYVHERVDIPHVQGTAKWLSRAVQTRPKLSWK